MMNRKSGLLALLVASLSAIPALSHAAAAEAFTAAVATTTTDVGAYGAALVGVGAVGVGFMIAIKYIKKIRGAA